MNLGSTELLIIFVLVIVVFGAGWLPKAARNLGRAKVEVDKAQRQIAETRQQVIEATGVEQADAALRKANRALNQSPQSLLRQGLTARPADGAAEPEHDDALPSDETINVDFDE